MSVVRIPCRTCGRGIRVDEEAPLPADFPFCTDRCRLVDLGKWLDGEHRIAGRDVASATPGDEEPGASAGSS